MFLADFPTNRCSFYIVSSQVRVLCDFQGQWPFRGSTLAVQTPLAGRVPAEKWSILQRRQASP